MLDVACNTFPPIARGLRAAVTLLLGVFMALLREPRAEGATRLRPVDLGRLLDLDLGHSVIEWQQIARCSTR